MHGQLPPAEARSRPVGRLDEVRRLNLALGLPLRNQAALTHLLRDLYDPANPRYQQWLTAAQFAEQFGPTEQDYQSLGQFARSHRLQVVATHANRTLLDVNGTVADIEKAFHVQMRLFRHPTENRNFYSPDTEPSLDLDLPLLTISGLDDFVLPHPMSLVTTSFGSTNVTPAYVTGSGPGGYFIGGDFRAAYAPGVALAGNGQSVGLLEFDGYYPSDITIYESMARLPGVPLTNILLDNFSGTPGSGNLEVALDIEMAICMAPALSQVRIYEGSVPNDVLNKMATENASRQLSSSWSFQINSNTEQIYQQFAAQGQSMFQASGDSGAYGGTNRVKTPCDDPNITVVGGTSLTTAGPGGPWLAETTWSGGGGGVSPSNAIPAWQQGVSMTANHGSSSFRNLPDVACEADISIWLVAYDGEEGPIGGSSASTPLWAGFTALVNQQAAANGRPSIGFANPALYAIGEGSNYNLAFHDITTGNNTNGGSPSNFFAVPGYDLCTGWGTPAGSNLINALALPPDALNIVPATNLTASGPVGGPFSPAAQNIVLTNIGTNTLSWTVGSNVSWVAISPAIGTLEPGGAASTVVLSINSNAASLGSGVSTATISFTNVTDGAIQIRTLTVEVLGAPVITQEPVNESAPAGNAVVFTVGAVGAAPLAYQWQWDGTNLTDGGSISGSSSSALTLANVTTASAGNYSVIASNGLGSASSTEANLTVVSLNAAGVAFTTLYSFSGGLDGSTPNGLMQHTNGNFYGTTQAGGTNAQGTIFQINGAETMATLYSFSSVSNGGYTPMAGLAQGSDGLLYGTTQHGGTQGFGVVYKSTTNGTVSRVVIFNNSGDGADANSVMIRGADGALYGTAELGGANKYGTAFRVTTNGGLTTLAAFNYFDGYNPTELFQAINGSFYGTTLEGGASGAGSVFQLGTNGMLTGLFSFNYTNGGGFLPYAGLVQTPDGNFFGTTDEGGAYGSGTIFEMSSAGVLTNIYSFTGGDDGGNPAARLTLAADGNLYGTTAYGGFYDDGTIFRISPAGILTTLVQFNGSNGANPQSALVQGADGNFYGTTANGGASNAGAVFLVNVNEPVLEITGQPASQNAFLGTTPVLDVAVLGNPPLFYQWQRDGANLTDGGNIAGSSTRVLTLPNVNFSNAGIYSVIVSNFSGSVTSDDAVLGVAVSPPQFTAQPVSQSAQFGGSVIFTAAAVGDFPLSYQWRENGSNLVDGGQISGSSTTALTLASLAETNDGNYSIVASNAIAAVASSNALLTVYAISINGTTMAALHGFTGGLDGGFPNGLMQASNGLLYGTTQNGGAYGSGTIFSLSTNGIFTSLAAFDGANGAMPVAGLVQGTNGLLYGTTKLGGGNAAGTVFSVTTNGVITTVYSFASNNDSIDPFTALLQDAEGNFYGATTNNASSGNGNIFELSAAGLVSTLHSFPGGSNGTLPAGALALGPDGNFYGTTTTGGVYGDGNIFKMTPTGVVSNIYSFTGGEDGYAPAGRLALGSDGNFYGVTKFDIVTNNGVGNQFYGVIYKATPTGAFTTLYKLNGAAVFTDGAIPVAGVIQGSDGNFYGTTLQGFYLIFDGVVYNNTNGTVFGMTPGGAFFTMTSFNGNDDGAYPRSELVEGADGSLYGTATAGGPGGQGTVFRVSFTAPPQIITQPASQTFPAGSNAAFNVTIFGQPPLYYQWLENGTNLIDGGNLSGSSSRILTLTNIVLANAGTYSVLVSNSVGTAVSSSATLTVTVPPPKFLSVAQNAGTLALTWSAVPGQLYQLQSSPSLAPAHWSNLGSAVSATNFTMTATDSVAINTSKFYRVVMLP